MPQRPRRPSSLLFFPSVRRHPSAQAAPLRGRDPAPAPRNSRGEAAAEGRAEGLGGGAREDQAFACQQRAGLERGKAKDRTGSFSVLGFALSYLSHTMLVLRPPHLPRFLTGNFFLTKVKKCTILLRTDSCLSRCRGCVCGALEGGDRSRTSRERRDRDFLVPRRWRDRYQRKRILHQLCVVFSLTLCHFRSNIFSKGHLRNPLRLRFWTPCGGGELLREGFRHGCGGRGVSGARSEPEIRFNERAGAEGSLELPSSRERGGHTYSTSVARGSRNLLQAPVDC